MTTRKIDPWEAKDAANTLTQAEAIKADKQLHTAAKQQAMATINKMQTVVNTPSKPVKKVMAPRTKPAVIKK